MTTIFTILILITIYVLLNAIVLILSKLYKTYDIICTKSPFILKIYPEKYTIIFDINFSISYYPITNKLTFSNIKLFNKSILILFPIQYYYLNKIKNLVILTTYTQIELPSLLNTDYQYAYNFNGNELYNFSRPKPYYSRNTINFKFLN